MNNRSEPRPADANALSILCVGDNRRRGHRAVAILLAGGLLASMAAADDAGQAGAAPMTAAPQSADPVFGAFSSLHARQQWLEAEIARHQKQLAEAASGFLASQSALQEKEAVVAELRAQLADLEEANRAAEDARRLLTAENAKFAATLAQERIRAEADAQALRDRVEALQQRLTEMESQGVATRSRYVELEQGRDRALSANLFLQADKRELEGEVESQTQTLAELTRRIESLEATLESKQTEQDVLSDERAKLEEELAESRQRIDDLTRELGHALEDQQQHLGQVEELAESASSLEVQLAETTQAEKEATEHAEQVEARLVELEVSNVELTSRYDTLQASLDKAEAEAARLEAQRSDQLAATESAAAEQRRTLAETAELRASLETAREAAADANQRLKVVEETHAGAVVAVERLQQDKVELQASLEAEQERAAALQVSVEKMQSRVAEFERQGDGAVQAAADRDRLKSETKALTDELAQLKQTGSDAGRSAQAQLEAKESEIIDLKGQLGELQAALGQTESALTAIRERVPETAGGSVTEAQLRSNAAEQMQALREHDKMRGQMDAGEWKAARAGLEQAVYDEQRVLAQSLSAQGVYRVRRDDTLAEISRESYGNSNRWTEIFEANGHLLDDPDRVSPGMTLIIP